MELIESLQRANQEQRLVEWSRRVEACRSSGLSVGQWCQENWDRGIRLFLLAKEGVPGAERSPPGVTFAKVPVMERPQPCEHIVAVIEVSGVRIQVYGGADGATLQPILQAAKSC